MIRLALIAIVVTLMPASARASNISILGEDPRDKLMLTVRGAKVGQVLRNLSQKYSFALQGLEKVEKSETLSLSMTGDLEEILKRVLRNWNHMIVRSPSRERPIEKVMILDATYGAVPMQAPPSTVASGAPSTHGNVAREQQSHRQVPPRRHRRAASRE